MVYYILYIICYALYVICYMLYVVCYMSYVICYIRVQIISGTRQAAAVARVTRAALSAKRQQWWYCSPTPHVCTHLWRGALWYGFVFKWLRSVLYSMFLYMNHCTHSFEDKPSFHKQSLYSGSLCINPLYNCFRNKNIHLLFPYDLLLFIVWILFSTIR